MIIKTMLYTVNAVNALLAQELMAHKRSADELRGRIVGRSTLRFDTWVQPLARKDLLPR